MTRPRKQTVDWFPHSCNHGKTIFVLEKRFDISGYYFWFRMLEVLGNTEGHFIDTNDIAALEYLQAFTHTNKETCQETLDLLATLEAIDPELWREKIIWSENFVRGLLPLYRNRASEIPVKPDILRKKPHNKDTGGDNPRKLTVEEGEEGEEGKERKEGEEGPSPPKGGNSPSIPIYSCKHFIIDKEYIDKLLSMYPGLTYETLQAEISKAHDWLDDNPRRHKRRATGEMANPRSFLNNWMKNVIIPGQSRRPTTTKEPAGWEALRESSRRRGEDVD